MSKAKGDVIEITVNGESQMILEEVEYTYYVALLLILEGSIRPAIEKGNKVDRAVEYLFQDLMDKDVMLAKLVNDFYDKLRHYYADRKSIIRAQYVKDGYGRIHRRILELIQMGDWRLNI